METLFNWLILIVFFIALFLSAKYGKPLKKDSNDTTTDWNRENDIRDFY